MIAHIAERHLIVSPGVGEDGILDSGFTIDQSLRD